MSSAASQDSAMQEDSTLVFFSVRDVTHSNELCNLQADPQSEGIPLPAIMTIPKTRVKIFATYLHPSAHLSIQRIFILLFPSPIPVAALHE